MKKLFLGFLFLLFFISCREELSLYSCDPVLNEMIINHKEEYATIEVTQISVLDIAVQRAIFRSFTPSKKRQIWIDKFQFLLRNENYCFEEYNHIQSLINHLHENYFVDSFIVKELESRIHFLSDWENYAKINLGWSDKYLLFTMQRLYLGTDLLDKEISALQNLTVQASNDPEVSCDCSRISDSCLGSLCGITDCQQSSGCGLLWQFTCDGNCR